VLFICSFFVLSYYASLCSEFRVVFVSLRVVVSIGYCVVFLRLECPELPVSLNWPFLIAPSVFFNVILK